MSRNLLFVLVGVLIVVSIGLGVALYQERQKSASLEISIGSNGIAVQKK